MSLPDLITHIIIEDTNWKECASARAKALSAKANTIEDRPSLKRYEKKPDHKKNKSNFSIPVDPNPPSRRRETALFVESQVTMHLSANLGSRTTILLRQI